MKARTMVALVAAAAVLGGGGYAAYQAGMARGMKMAAREAAPADSGRRILYWHDPMVPGQRFDKPGKSPFMDMPLQPVYEDEAGRQGGVAIDPSMQQSLGVRTAEVRKGTLAPVVEAVGNVAYNERETALVQARSNGFVERLYVRAPLDPVRKGEPLAQLYVPDWVAAQEEFLSARRMAGTSLEAVVDGARQRMRLAGMSDEQIRVVESTGKVQARLTLVAPATGVVAELGAREGMTVAPGSLLFRINGLDTVWVNAEVPEAQSGEVQVGNPVEARTPGLPGKVFKGKVSAILPEVNPTTRTLKARVELANPRTELKPGMFATVNFTPVARREALLVPSEAVIRTGRRTVVIVTQGDGRFAPVDVQAGLEAGGETEIRSGLAAGQRVVLSGQFLIDSEANLRASETRMAGPAYHRGTGKVLSVSPMSSYVELEHDPIASLKWPAMTMGFQVEDKSQLLDLKEGDRVEFELDPNPGKDGEFVLRSIRRSGGP
jgi:Cu(I)/Ag(I) efflux system membrane fusion protein